MKLKTGTFSNFGSYKNLDLDFTDLGLALIYGKTGAGKSTIMDAVCWTLFGKTAKDGNSDEVRSWQAGTDTTIGYLELDLEPGVITITRIRGRASQNDLYWTEGDNKYRGKDISETQKLLNARLGFDFDTYSSAAYYHEFSPTSSFFLAKSKERKALLEKIVSLEFPTKLAEKASYARKEVKAEHERKERELARACGQLEQLEQSIKDTNSQSALWQSRQDIKIAKLRDASQNFERNKDKTLEDLNNTSGKWVTCLVEKIISLENLISEFEIKVKGKCPTCGQIDKKEIELLARYKSDLAQAKGLSNPYFPKIGQAMAQTNNFEVILSNEITTENPHLEQLTSLNNQLNTGVTRLEELTLVLTYLESRLNDLNTIYDLSSILRGELVKREINAIQDRTNQLLQNYYDSEIQVVFTADEDNLEVAIQKSGYDCTYKQLSKGQRSLLKLCFSVSVMEAASNKAGVRFQDLFFDESMDGQDEELKLKTFSLFQELETKHSSILVIDHATIFHNMFNKRFNVTLSCDHSTIKEDET